MAAPGVGWLIPRPHTADPLARSLTPWPVHPMQDHNMTVIGPLDFVLGLDAECRAQNLSRGAVLEDWIRRCPECDPRYINPLSEKDIRSSLSNLMSMVEACDPYDPGNGIQAYIMDRLNKAKHADGPGPRPSGYRITVYSQREFRSLAYISNKCRSTQIGLVLYDFFTRNVRWIASNNSRKALWQWCSAVMMSSMPEGHKRSCMSALHVMQPAVFDPSSIRGQEGQVRQLTELVEDLVDMLHNGRPRRHNPYGSPRRFGSGYRSSDDDDYYQSRHRRPRDYDEAEEEVKRLERKLNRSRRQLSKFGHDGSRYGGSYLRGWARSRSQEWDDY